MEADGLLDFRFGFLADGSALGLDLLYTPGHVIACLLAGPDGLHRLPEWVARWRFLDGLNDYLDPPRRQGDVRIQFQGAIWFECPLDDHPGTHCLLHWL